MFLKHKKIEGINSTPASCLSPLVSSRKTIQLLFIQGITGGFEPLQVSLGSNILLYFFWGGGRAEIFEIAFGKVSAVLWPVGQQDFKRATGR